MTSVSHIAETCGDSRFESRPIRKKNRCSPQNLRALCALLSVKNYFTGRKVETEPTAAAIHA